MFFYQYIGCAYEWRKSRRSSVGRAKIIESKSRFIAGIVIFYLIGLWILLRGFPGIRWIKKDNLLPSFWELAKWYHQAKERDHYNKIKDQDMKRLENDNSDRRMKVQFSSLHGS
mmetsp:Transcript_14997/g.22693  ORF Transcript_14997/g.22693 Transcript_14997/m.22693 type:complete len:114 (+) Transcript_14997:1244-1585(+)